METKTLEEENNIEETIWKMLLKSNSEKMFIHLEK